MSHVSPWSAAQTAAHLHRATDDDDKYSRGVVGMRTGSARYPGAAVLGVEAAWRAGAGMVRYVGPDAAASLVLARRPETVRGGGRVQAWVIGSGMADVDTDAPDAVGGGSDAGGVGLAEILVGREPVVVDAGALGLTGATAPRVLTPHRGELARLRARLGMSPDWADDAAAARETAVATGATVLLKGARTWVATPGGWLGLVESGAPWLSTAGTGDVLAGVVGALVAARSSAVVADPEALGPLAASAAWLHGAAGRIASGTARADGGLGSGEATRTAGAGHPLVALEVAEAIPTVWARLIG
jgi:hydroxyethylthiazole kinase-like uncharacterized protein yjeF